MSSGMSSRIGHLRRLLLRNSNMPSCERSRSTSSPSQGQKCKNPIKGMKIWFYYHLCLAEHEFMGRSCRYCCIFESLALYLSHWIRLHPFRSPCLVYSPFLRLDQDTYMQSDSLNIPFNRRIACSAHCFSYAYPLTRSASLQSSATPTIDTKPSFSACCNPLFSRNFVNVDHMLPDPHTVPIPPRSSFYRHDQFSSLRWSSPLLWHAT